MFVLYFVEKCENNDISVVLFQSQWEKATDKRIQRNVINRRVERLMQAENFKLEDRRER